MKSVLLIFLIALTHFGVDSCKDSLGSICSYYKRIGYCRVQKDMMLKSCKRTCDFCNIATMSPVTTLTPIATTVLTRPITTAENPGTKRPTKTTIRQCGRSAVRDPRIVNGKTAKKGAWPWLASLQYRRRSHHCGGTLIAPNWVLTAAHCVGGIPGKEDRWGIEMGAHNLMSRGSAQQYSPVKRAIKHPEYNPKNLHADHALIELTRPFKMTDRVTLGCLPDAGSQVPVGTQECYIAGWGSTRHPGNPTNILRQARLPVVPVEKCRHQLEVICAGFGLETSANACRGDSGGPFMCKNDDGTWTVHGVASYVVTYCKYYTGFSPVHKYIDWIRQYVDV